MRLFLLIVGVICGAMVGIGIDQKRSAEADKDTEPEGDGTDEPRERFPEVEYDLESQEW